MRVKTDQPSDDAWKQAHLAMLVRLGKRQSSRYSQARLGYVTQAHAGDGGALRRIWKAAWWCHKVAMWPWPISGGSAD